ncbi:CHASE4 domain-containing protein [Methanobacterium spitsbergense]|uniref:histidine kinase n=1 Tax=Methanobacterium spitsbergense TaxID=2874285 RepID=A0A8T5UZR0_9EURY|nr:CHASE4 domain-containing protein [Methanobacterium spitsbergense]MBZ2166660.1 PAS domain S-box protein [Methanobacterium spitsbergense]
MKLRSKTLVLSGVIIVAMVLILLVISQFVFLNTYSDFENRYSQHVMKDEMTQFNQTISSMNQTANDWAHWDDAYSFVSGNNPSFITNNLPSSIFSRLHMNLIMFVDDNGKIVYGKAYDLQTNQSMNLPQNFTSFTNDSAIIQHKNLEGLSGILNLPEGALLLISKPILNSHEQGPVKGTLIMGRYLTREELTSFVNIPNNTLSVAGYNNANNAPDLIKAQNSLSYNNTTVQILGPNSVAAYILLKDIYGNPSLILKSEMARTLYNSYLNTVLYFIVSIILVGLLFMGLVLYYLDRNVLNRLDKIISDILDIGKKGDLKRRVKVSGDDELSDLASSINNTFHALQKSEKQLEDSEEKYRSIFENTGTAMIITDENMNITLANRIFQNILNPKGDQIKRKLNWIEMLVPDDREKIKNYHKIDEKKDVNSAIVPKTYEVQSMIKGDLRDFFATFEFIPGTKSSLISLIDITDRKRAEGLLKTSLKEKELLLREIHHRVKNSLQIISSLLSLQASEFDDNLIIEKYKESENRIHTIALIHENLYQSTDISNIDFKNYLEILIDDIMYSYKVDREMIKTVLDLNDYELGIETAIPVGLIINELVSNALKHAFKSGEKGEIKIVLEKYDDTYTLTVQDNGIGLPDEIHPENSKSLGLMLVNALVTQLDGKMSFEVKNGTAFKIIFKELEYQERI